jgi:hypothetical protein
MEKMLMALKDDYLARAAAAFAEAEAASLQNVKDRCLRSAEAWSEMAASVQWTETLRANREAENAAAANAAVDARQHIASAMENCDC